MGDKGTTRDVSAREALACIRQGMSNAELMAKFKLNPQGYADLLRQLFQKRLITQEDLERRGIRFKVVKKKQESEPVPQAQVVPAATAADDDEFLDTMALTDLLTFKPGGETGLTPVKSKPAQPEAPQTEEEDGEATDKKKKFTITGFFKKPF